MFLDRCPLQNKTSSESQNFCCFCHCDTQSQESSIFSGSGKRTLHHTELGLRTRPSVVHSSTVPITCTTTKGGQNYSEDVFFDRVLQSKNHSRGLSLGVSRWATKVQRAFEVPLMQGKSVYLPQRKYFRGQIKEVSLCLTRSRKQVCLCPSPSPMNHSITTSNAQNTAIY
jgi:hypothetical protein